MNRTRSALICAPFVPEFDRESGSRRIFHLIELLRDGGWSVTFAPQYSQGANDERYLKVLRQMGVMTFSVIDAATERWFAAGRFDIAIFAFWYLAEQYIPILRQHSPGTRIIVDSIDLHFLREARQAFQTLPTQPEPERSSRLPKTEFGATIIAVPNPVPEGLGSGKTVITWNSGNGEEVCVYVSVDRAEEKLFAHGAQGTSEAAWIVDGHTYEFRLYSSDAREQLLGEVLVTMTKVSNSLGPIYASKMIREVNAYASADAVLTVSQKEADLLNDLVGDPMLAHTMPDYDELNASPIPMQKRKGILFVGNFKHAPNVAAVEHLCQNIAPRLSPAVLTEHPIYILGNALDEKILSYQNDRPYVRMVGWVPSLVPYLERARVSVVPLTYGAGTKRKLLHALMVGSPTVSTSVGTEGLSLKHGEHVLVADNPDTFAESITRLLEDSELWHKLSRKGRARALALQGRKTARAHLLNTIHMVLEQPLKTMTRMGSGRGTISVSRKLPPAQYQSLIGRIHEAVQQTLPAEGLVLVASRGDDALLQLDRRQAWHFPRTNDGEYAGHHPSDSNEAIAHIEALRAKGAEYFLLPQTALWWLDHYSEFRRHLEENYTVAYRREDTCVIYLLRSANNSVSSPITTVKHNGYLVNGEAQHKSARARLIAFYLPQFYPTAENNVWWGEGFTEWTNVAKARSLFDGHHQPHLPGNLGFYDLRVPEVRQAQADLARKHGIEGFCYWHYWFHGKRLLDRPFEEVLRSSEPNFPFCLSWANETWSRRWHGSGGEKEVLQEQTYSREDDISHGRWLARAFADRRYVRVDGRPLFLVYRAADLPNSRRTTDILRSESVKAGVPEPYLVGINSHKDLDYRTLGFDATLDFEPQLGLLAGYAEDGLKTYDYVRARQLMTSRQRNYPVHPCIFVRWDNTPRRGGDGIVFINSTPEHFQSGLTELVRSVQGKPSDQRLIFINAWNEWAEGNHLEPDQEFGQAYLEATTAALLAAEDAPGQSDRLRAPVPNGKGRDVDRSPKGANSISALANTTST